MTDPQPTVPVEPPERSCVFCGWSGDIGATAHATLIHPGEPWVVVVQMGREFVVRADAARASQPVTATTLGDLPARVVVGKNGAYWRDYGDSYSMCPVSTDNDPIVPVAVYIPENVPDTEATPAGDRDWPTVLAWWQDLARQQGIRAERAEVLAALPVREDEPTGESTNG